MKISYLRKKYSNKLIKICPETIESLKAQIKLLPFKESLIDVRKSRIYNVSTKNISLEGIKIKGILFPFKQLRFVKK
jgi:hypothetical protein